MIIQLEEAEDMAEAFGDLALALVFSIFLVYAVMAVQFENFLHPFVIMFALPTTVVGVILGLFVTGLPFNISLHWGHHARRYRRQQRHRARRLHQYFT